MTILLILGYILAGITILACIASLLQFDDWWIRAWDFPRVQIVILGVVALLILGLAQNYQQWYDYALIGALALSIGYQASKIFPYTPLARKEVKLQTELQEDEQISLLISNVLTPNRNAAGLLQLVRNYNPDLVLTLESDHWWEEQLETLIHDYPHAIRIPLDNLYGMHLYSRLPLQDPQVRYLIEDDIPSIRTRVQLPSGREILLYCLHPAPPSPTENYASTDRDAELLLVGKEIKDKEGPIVVAGDLNDVAWSYTTTLFQEISGMLDPRKGRGFFSTFHARYRIARWPLDHIFHSNHFTLVDIERLPAYGSDHFPIFARLQFEPSARSEQPRPRADAQSEQRAEEKIRNGKNGQPETVLDGKGEREKEKEGGGSD